VRGRLVVFEGGEGVGKSTQLRRLAARLEAAGVRHRLFREPGGTAVGDRIRDLLLHSDVAQMPIAATTEASLFIASRAQLVAQEIAPARKRGVHVLLDRFLLSTYAYQVFGRKLTERHVRDANRLATGRLRPDLTILLAMDPVDGLKRITSSRGFDRIEQADLDFHWRVANAFVDFADEAWQRKHPECGPIVAVDASGNEDEVETRVLRIVQARVPELFGGVKARA